MDNPQPSIYIKIIYYLCIDKGSQTIPMWSRAFINIFFNFNIDKMKKIVKKLSKEQKALLIALFIGDGTISNNNVFKLSHSIEQKEYLMWKISLLNDLKIKNNGLKSYTSNCGYNKGKEVVYTQLSIIPFIKVLRKCFYTPKKIITKSLLNWLDPRGLAIWYMDDGHLNVNTSLKRSSFQYTVHLTTCVDKQTALLIKEYFSARWQINFRIWEERPNLFSLATSEKSQAEKFLLLIKPYIMQVPSLLYKIRKNYTKEIFIKLQSSGSKCETLV